MSIQQKLEALKADVNSTFAAIGGDVKTLDTRSAATAASLENEKLVMMGYNSRIAQLEQQLAAFKDTGWRDIKQELGSMMTTTNAPEPFQENHVFAFRRIGDRCFMFVSYAVVSSAIMFANKVPECFRPIRDTLYTLTNSSVSNFNQGLRFLTTGDLIATSTTLNMSQQSAIVLEYIPQGEFPTAIPGTPWNRTAG